MLHTQTRDMIHRHETYFTLRAGDMLNRHKTRFTHGQTYNMPNKYETCLTKLDTYEMRDTQNKETHLTQTDMRHATQKDRQYTYETNQRIMHLFTSVWLLSVSA